MVEEITKIKLFKEPAINNSRKIKVTHAFHADYHFSVDMKERMEGLPLQYFWFAKLVTMRLAEKGCDFKKPYAPEIKFQAPNTPAKYIGGIIYKLSQHLKNWELRYIVIGPEGLASFKNETSPESFKVPRETATELWTRFDIR